MSKQFFYDLTLSVCLGLAFAALALEYFDVLIK
jgi:hypothetical protein